MSRPFPKAGERAFVEVKRRFIRRPGQSPEYVYVPWYRNVEIVHDCQKSLAQTMGMMAQLYPLDEESVQELGLTKHNKETQFWYILNEQYKCGKPRRKK
jgi:hypothetical protein